MSTMIDASWPTGLHPVRQTGTGAGDFRKLRAGETLSPCVRHLATHRPVADPDTRTYANRY